MMSPVLTDELIKILFVLALGTAAVIITFRTIKTLFYAYTTQSVLIALIALALFIKNGSYVLLLIMFLTVTGKVVLIPYIMRKIQNKMEVKRDVEFRYLTPIPSILVSTALVFLVYRTFSPFRNELSRDGLFFFGAVIGVSLTLMGMLVIVTRRKMITKVLGYLTMENGVLLFGLFVSELPLIIELLVTVDLIVLVVLATVLAFGIDSTVEEFHRRLGSFPSWFKE